MKGRTMQIKKRHLGILVLAMASIIALAFGAVAAHAEPGTWWPPDNTNTLTVNLSDDDAIVNDLGDNVEVDLYLVAKATPNSDYQYFDYEAVNHFESLGDPNNGNALPSNLTTDDWMALAQSAADIVYPENAEESAFDPDFHALAGEEINNLGDGIYLVLVHGGQVHNDSYQGSAGYDVYDGYYAYNSALTKKYTFTPTLIALPNTDNGSTSGVWDTSITIPTMKYEIEPLYGSLRIKKTVTDDDSNEPATFVFHLVGTTPDGAKYENNASIYYEGGGSGETTVTHIPAGTKLTVTEEYSGARFEYVSGNGEAPIIVADQVVDMPEAFVNKADGTGRQGYGIENNFKLDETGDWTWNRGTPGPWEERTK